MKKGKRAELSKIISEKINKEINDVQLRSVLALINNLLADKLLEERILTIDKFGTFVLAKTPKGRILNVNTKKMSNRDVFYTVKFYSNYRILNCLKQKKGS